MRQAPGGGYRVRVRLPGGNPEMGLIARYL